MGIGTILIRADASVQIGTGHAMRCLALAQAWQDRGGEAVFALAQSAPAIVRRLTTEKCAVVSVQASTGTKSDANLTLELAKKYDAKWIVTDGYLFNAAYHRSLKNARRKLLRVYDNANSAGLDADLVLNQNLHATNSPEQWTYSLLGPKFAMLRREFNAWQNWRRSVAADARHILVSMGGSDPGGLTMLVIQALELACEQLNAIVVAGGSNPHIASLRAEAARSKGKVRLVVDPVSMPDLMAQADIAILSAGSVCWETCMLGLPAIVVDAAENQIPIAQELHRRQVALHLPCSRLTPQTVAEKIQLLADSAKLRALMSQKGAELVDGRGSARVVAAMRARELTMRYIQPEDCHVVWEWANDTAARAASFSSSTISWGEHKVWFSEKLKIPQNFLIFENGDVPAAAIRFQSVTGHDADISITLAPEIRGQGLAPGLLQRALTHAFRERKIERVHAFIKPSNRASSKAFESAGFRLMGTTEIEVHKASHYVCEPPLIVQKPGCSESVAEVVS